VGEAPQGARHPQACRRGCNVETGGEFWVRQLVDDPQLERFPLRGGEGVELMLQRKTRRQAFLDFGEAILGGEVERQPEPLASARLDLISPDGVRENVAGDPKQPRQRRAVVVIVEPIDAQQSPRERLRGEVAGRPGKTPGQPRVHVADVPGVQL